MTRLSRPASYLYDSVAKAKPLVNAQSCNQMKATSVDSARSCSIGAARWTAGRAAMAASIWACRAEVTATEAMEAKVGSMTE
jgi:hypothetical protein